MKMYINVPVGYLFGTCIKKVVYSVKKSKLKHGQIDRAGDLITVLFAKLCKLYCKSVGFLNMAQSKL